MESSGAVADSISPYVSPLSHARVVVVTPRLIQWLGGGLILAILVVVNIAAVKEILSGGNGARTGWFVVSASAVIVMATIALKLVTSRRGSGRKRKRNSGPRR